MTIKYFALAVTPSQTTSFPYTPALSSLVPPHDTNEGQLWASRKAHLKKQLQQEMVSALKYCNEPASEAALLLLGLHIMYWDTEL